MFHVKQFGFDVVVVGAGHAGCEAALAASRLGASVALVTFSRNDIGTMSCNPAIGGLGKGHLVREIDALDGAMARVADASGIQFRLLNRRKGPAVRGPRAQIDRDLYRVGMTREIENALNLRVIEGEVVDLLVSSNEAARGVLLSDGSEVDAKTVVLTVGTFLGGVIHIGNERHAGGRMGARSAKKLAERIRSGAFAVGRLKTGTPPRLHRNTINWAGIGSQPGDEQPTFFSFLTRGQPNAAQISCGITHTNGKTHEIIRENLHQSAMYGGMIDGIGPRYCPSIEDKVVRFTEKDSHQVFVEPEGLKSDLVYPNGISTSLPADIQIDYVRSIAGFERAKIAQPGYAIEYDYVDPRSLDRTLLFRSIPNLYLAGQINGTTGYEEAGAQGLVAGLNAARASSGVAGITFSRSDGYIGVLIDDLVTRGVSEPYRMFTSRAEYRLTLRADNADSRLTDFGRQIGLVKDPRWKKFAAKKDRLSTARSALKSTKLGPQAVSAVVPGLRINGPSRSAYDVLSLAGAEIAELFASYPHLKSHGYETVDQLQNEAVYSMYEARQDREISALERDEAILLPKDLDYRKIGSLSKEVCGKLELARPETIAQAGRIEGVTPAALTAILAHTRGRAKRSA
ncbi:tRNA uridine-5-carboxymethylaminomethyl(34) synthesis enzyme MnmG [Jannaschia seosinensis]|uniref:tRNA uridine-5-carboxymethylaminomethyl(34) synthesis enzyme MnmG n=1 Tax=Jannaschia seosinensis TaxID=313367 RepID=UPI0009FA20A9|nr:tRNA uridine-5-carboxymethylaminomethyl(34) synthesis enzyme MnmG [Jannaschia seosinensis]